MVLHLSALTGLLCALAVAGQGPDHRLLPYIDALKNSGRPPVRFVTDKLQSYDLIVFDDALHTAVEPFEFYQELIKDAAFQKCRPAIFLEVLPSNKQRHIDAYLNAANEDKSLLFPAFQDDVNSTGFPYKTYFDLLKTIRDVNQNLSAKNQLRVYGVGSPTFWKEIETPEDLRQFHKSLAGYDHHMYITILNELDQFRGAKKGIYLCNTRHAYKGIKRKDGQYFWNTTTFFTQRHPGKAYSIRIHNVTLFIQAVKQQTKTSGSAEGLDRIEYKFVRVAHGLWDSAFRALGDRSIAFPLAGNVFGAEPYIGNHQLDAMPGQSMQDAYDAVIFLAPLEKCRETALVDFVFTPAFKQELKRRYTIMHTPTELVERFKQYRVDNLDDLIEKMCTARPERPLSQLRDLGPINEWKTRSKK